MGTISVCPSKKILFLATRVRRCLLAESTIVARIYELNSDDSCLNNPVEWSRGDILNLDSSYEVKILEQNCSELRAQTAIYEVGDHTIIILVKTDSRACIQENNSFFPGFNCRRCYRRSGRITLTSYLEVTSSHAFWSTYFRRNNEV